MSEPRHVRYLAKLAELTEKFNAQGGKSDPGMSVWMLILEIGGEQNSLEFRIGKLAKSIVDRNISASKPNSVPRARELDLEIQMMMKMMKTLEKELVLVKKDLEDAERLK